MLHSEVHQLELLASIDDLRNQIMEWTNAPSDWEPIQRCQSLLKRVLERVETLRVRMESPLVVATFGGTGTGKSTLVNALVGEEVTRSGRQRPTTRKPVLICHAHTDLSLLTLPLEEVEVVQSEADLLRDVMILDCPDPDTSEGETSGSNLDRLRTLLPYCDVLLYVSTQQKYRSARVADELASAASGCRMVFVQTHAGLDEDIREDWAKTLSGEYEVPEIFFVDSVKALQEQHSGQRPSGDMGRLIDLLLNKLRASDRVRIRRTNVLDLLYAGLSRCRQILAEKRPKLDELTTALAAQKQDLSVRMSNRLQQELMSSRSLWERRLVSAVTDDWGMSPFSAVLRIYNGLGGIIASMTLFRARSTAQVALLGTMQGMRWLESKRKEQAAESSLQRVSRFGLDDALLREAEIVIDGHVAAAGLRRELLQGQSLDDLRRHAADAEDQFVNDAGRRIDEIIQELAKKNSRWWIRGLYEISFSGFLIFILTRVAKNFFYDSLLYNTPFLTSDFYLAAGLFLILWCGLLIISFTHRLRRGLKARVQQLSSRMVETRLGRSLFPQLDEAVRRSQMQAEDIERLLARTVQLRQEFSSPDSLGSKSLKPSPQPTTI